MKTYRVIVSDQAKESLKNIITYIKRDSVSAAKHVRKELINIIKSLKNHPEKFSKEPLLSGKSKNYRSVSKWHYKIVYLCLSKEVIMLDIIHTSRNPEDLSSIR